MNLAINLAVNPYIAAAVLTATAVTDAAYVFFNAAVVARHRIRAANWSSIWYLLSAFSVISYTGESDLCDLRRDRFVARRLCIGDLAGARATIAAASYAAVTHVPQCAGRGKHDDVTSFVRATTHRATARPDQKPQAPQSRRRSPDFFRNAEAG